MSNTCYPHCHASTIYANYFESSDDRSVVYVDLKCNACGRLYPVKGGEDRYPDE